MESAASARLRTQISSLPSLLSGVSRDALEQRIGGKWSVTENLAHVARYHEVFARRVRAILEENEPTFPPYRVAEEAVSSEAVVSHLRAHATISTHLVSDTHHNQLPAPSP